MNMAGSDLGAFVQNLAAQRGWGWNMANGEYMVEVPTQGGRTQVVHIMTGNDPDGMPMIYVWSPVGPMHLAQMDPIGLLARNTELSWGACAIFNNMLVVKDGQLYSTADQEELLRMIFYVGKAADDLEIQLTGMDQQ